MGDATRTLEAAGTGDRRAAAELLAAVYDELRALAAARLACEAPGRTLQPTALVHEAYLRLVPAGGFANRAHFFAAAAEAMRRILVEDARRRGRVRHGGGRRRVPLDGVEIALAADPDDVLDLDDALAELAAVAPQRAELVRLRFYAGLEIEDAAACLGISRATAARWWAYSRAWLFRRLDGGREESAAE